ncbi:MAG: DUF4364 family protein [Defluviitaleaceae bacterium]|nr:DUF4364 family protein [Defluviitaleaceae bacterium]
MSADESIAVENKLLLLYLIDKMDLPLTRSQITDFVRDGEYMEYYTLQQTLADMVSDGYLEMAQENNNTRYSITDEGLSTLEYFERHIPGGTRAKINKYVHDNFNSVKRDYEITANYFQDNETNEYIVKCGVYDDDRLLMEINISVVSREQARLIQRNWKSNVTSLYVNILRELIKETKPDKPEAAEAGESPEAPHN